MPALAEAQGVVSSLIAAALLHDVGHLFENDEAVAGGGIDDRHQIVGARAIMGLFGDAVCGPVSQHVAAKRYLCFKEPHYFQDLSAASKHSLKLQGGVFDAKEAAEFERILTGRRRWF